eukprot:TRINITY_DN2514_c0_g1_i1.p2 TRINITY_DN2514_c0_g1~~TRINITY_DN2514_c0_g1_i1.p2  ORF type:complete len:129 (+),score=18.63 TRINITY_DN2514_c0_g1_i1:50-388(+)
MSDEGGSTPVEEAEESWVLIDDEEQLELKPQEQEHSPREDLPETERPGAQVLALSGPGSSANQPVDSSSLNVQQPPPILQKPPAPQEHHPQVATMMEPPNQTLQQRIRDKLR